MAKQIIYWGEFRSVAGTLYRVEILSDDKSYTAQRVFFPHDTPVEIEWNEVDKLEPVQGACLTLSLVSKSDRQFIDLYSIEVGKVRIDVYRDGALYWSGTLDPELYEEPYSQKKDYDVRAVYVGILHNDYLSVSELLDVEVFYTGGYRYLSLGEWYQLHRACKIYQHLYV